MRTDSRLSRVLHVLLHMIKYEGALTSEQIGVMLDTNSVVVRRTLSGLRKAGVVKSEKGHGGGWRLTRDPKDITLLDIYQLIGSPQLFAIGFDHTSPTCAVEASVNKALGQSLTKIESILLNDFANISLQDLYLDFEQHCQRLSLSMIGCHKK
ncbi:Rrf2 family transcriptional regulator [Gynuella sp.]|uniref:Rrf2 family transcriptional regulator n=1 Tax=Gynuella sp. TaxID=2969146 RepID=UPI003D10D802